ncbi:hypothetical protein GQ457_05G015120 [Hibiscus cannabinus]
MELKKSDLVPYGYADPVQITFYIGESYLGSTVIRVLKFNANGSVRGKLGPLDCGGFLGNDSGQILTIFSGLPGVLESNNEAELQAIRHALLFFKNSVWCDFHLIVESDSVVVVAWIMHTDHRP